MKRVKSNWRAGLITDTLDKFLRIVLSGPKLTDFKANPIVQGGGFLVREKKGKTVLHMVQGN